MKAPCVAVTIMVTIWAYPASMGDPEGLVDVCHEVFSVHLFRPAAFYTHDVANAVGMNWWVVWVVLVWLAIPIENWIVDHYSAEPPKPEQ